MSLRSSFLATFALLACTVVPAYAQQAPACAAQPKYPLPASRSELNELAQRLEPLSLQRACLNDPYFHAYRGAVLMALGEHVAALEPLERALLLQPDLPGAQLDLALAFAHAGQSEAARGLLAQLEERSDLPPGLRTALERQRLQVDAATSASAFHHRFQISMLGGAESNLNNAPAVSELTLTLPNGSTTTLPLAPSSLPRSGPSLLTTAQWQGLRAAGASLWVLQAEARVRNTREASTGFRQGDLAATWLQAPEAPRQWIARAASTWLYFGGQPLLRSTRGSLQFQSAGLGNGQAMRGLLGGAPCRPALGAELEDRHFPLTPELDGLYSGAVFSLVCPGDRHNGTGPTVFNLQLRAGRDRPDAADRPGGAQRRAELRVQWERPVASPWPGVLGAGRFGLQGSVVRQLDSTGYSALLQNNAVRQATRYSMQAEASFSLGGGLFAVGTAEAARQTSNLPAFTGRQRSLYFGLRWELM